MNTGFNYRRLALVDLPCALCGADEFEPLAAVDRYNHGVRTVGCKRCGLVQTSPRPSASDLEDFYRHHYRRVYQAREAPDEGYVLAYGKLERLDYTARRIAQVMSGRPLGPLLDCGCGEGTLFARLAARAVGAEFYGVEPNAAFASYAIRQGARAVFSSLDEAAASGIRFRTIVSIHALEHFPDPVEALVRLRCVATDDALLYVDVPDADRYRSIGDLHLAHLVHFNRHTLAAALRAAGWAPQRMEAHDPPRHPRSVLAIGCPGERERRWPDPAQSSTAWAAVRSIQRRRWLARAQLAVAAVPGARALWQASQAAWSGRRTRP